MATRKSQGGRLVPGTVEVMTLGPPAAVDPSAGRRPPRRPGRPVSTSMETLVQAAVDLGLDTFTLAGVAARAGVGESTVYNYVPGRDRLYAVAAASVFDRLDVEAAAEGWTDYVDVVAERAADLATAHPGLAAYVLHGPYEPTTVATFEAVIERVRGWLPDIPEHLAFVLASRPVVLTLGYVGDPVLAPVAPWLRRALLRGLDEMVAEGRLPPVPATSWRSKLAPPR
jgi:AcrR family transcriptional regulator